MTALDLNDGSVQHLRGARILILFPHVTLLGGAITYTLRLAEQLIENGATVGILSLQVDRDKFVFPEGLEIIETNGPVTSSMGYWLLFPYWQRLLNHAIIDWQPDVIVPQVFPSNWWGFLCKKKCSSIKLVWVCHEPSAFIHSPEWIGGLKPFWKKSLALILRPILSWVDISLSKFNDGIVSNSKFTSDLVSKTYGLSVENVAYPGIDEHFFLNDLVPKERALITVAHLTGYKRIDFLLKVFYLLRSDFNDLVYHIVGDGDELENLKDLAKKLGLNDSVIFHGRLNYLEISDLNRKSLLFLHGSINETFGMAPLEAISCGTPVIAHKSGGPMEYITEDCGKLIDSTEASVWAKEIAEYLGSFSADTKHSAKVRECAKSFDWSTSLRPAITTIEKILSLRK